MDKASLLFNKDDAYVVLCALMWQADDDNAAIGFDFSRSRIYTVGEVREFAAIVRRDLSFPAADRLAAEVYLGVTSDSRRRRKA